MFGIFTILLCNRAWIGYFRKAGFLMFTVFRSYGRLEIWIFLFIFHLASFPPAFGDDKKQSGLWPSFRENWTTRFDVNASGAYYHEDSTLDPADAGLGGNAVLQLSRDLGRGFMLRIDPMVYLDKDARGVRLFAEDHEDRPIFTLKEAFISWYGETVEIEAGKKIYSWEVADALSPVDMLNPTDLIEPLDSEKIGVPSVSVLKMFEAANVQAVFLPVFVADRSPPDTSRWTGGAAFVDMYGQQSVSDRAFPDNRYEKMSVALRLNSSTLLPGWDLAAIYRYGYSTRGVVRVEFDPLSSPSVVRTTEYPAYNFYGFTFSTAWGEIVGYGEAALHDTRDNEKGEDYLSYVLGVSHTSYNLLADIFEEIGFIMEYAGDAVLKERDSGSAYLDPGTSRGLSSNIIGSIKFKINEDHLLETAFTYNSSDEDSIFDFNGTACWNDNLEFTYGYQVLSGDVRTFCGQWDANDRFYLKMAITY